MQGALLHSALTTSSSEAHVFRQRSNPCACSLGLAAFQSPLAGRLMGVGGVGGAQHGWRGILSEPRIPAFGPRLQVCVPWQEFLLFSPSCEVRGTLEVSTLGGKGPGDMEGQPLPLTGQGVVLGWELGFPRTACRDLGHVMALLDLSLSQLSTVPGSPSDRTTGRQDGALGFYNTVLREGGEGGGREVERCGERERGRGLTQEKDCTHIKDL